MTDFPDRYADPANFIKAVTSPLSPPLVPEIQLYLAHEACPIWRYDEAALTGLGIPDPFWAFAWAGGQALARYILDHPETVRDKTVFDFATGTGIVAIAAAMAGAKAVRASDIDDLACIATRQNAELNDVAVEAITDDVIGTSLPEAVILVGDACYEQPLAGQVHDWLDALAVQGTVILLGDPKRSYLQAQRLDALQTYQVATSRELEDMEIRQTTVWRLRDSV